MAMRRPRIKPVANIQLNSKRKAKSTNDVKTCKGDESDINGVQEVEKQVNVLSTEQNKNAQTEQLSKSNENGLEVRVDRTVDTTANENSLNDTSQNENNGIGADPTAPNIEEAKDNFNIGKCSDIVTKDNKFDNSTEKVHLRSTNQEVTDSLKDSEAFKCPPKVGLQRAISHTSNSGVDDVFYSDIEENAFQMDLEKSPSHGCPMSPSKNLTRQRIRPTPHFGQRRNSFVGSSPSPHTSGNEDNSSSVNNEFVQPTQTRRERHHSASFTGNTHSSSSHHHHYHHTSHKYLPSGISNSSMGRIRTESGCSVFSDTNTSHKSRKTEDSKQNSRKDFEARFHNGVPEKSAIKMSDLIYYNPATNPMEQKPNPSVKVEQNEIASNDVKPFTEKLEKDTNTSAGSEAIPVPQLKLNAKGELILDDKSLVIETTAEQEARKVLANSSLIYLDENTGMNGFYSRQKRTREWLPSETIKFYRCLQNVGTDFSLMVSLFPNRTRRDLKLKFKKEERKNGNLINKALLYPKQFDLESLKQQIDEEEKLRAELAKNSKITKEKAKESKKRKICTSSVSNRILLNEDVYQNENDQIPKRTRKSNKCKEINQNNETNKQNVETAISSVETDKNDEVNNNHNEIERKPKQRKPYTKSKSASKKLNEEQIVANNNNNNNEDMQANENVKVDKIKRRRRRTHNKVQKEEIIIIKEEIIKLENKHDSNQTSATVAPPEYQDTKQLQTEIDELLDSDAVDIQYNGSTSYETSTTKGFPVTSQVTQYTEHVNATLCPVSYTTHYVQDNYIENDTDINKYEHRTFVNLDDGSVNVYSKIEDDSNYITSSPVIALPSLPPSTPLACPPSKENETVVETNTTTAIPESEIIDNDTCSSVISERELNEEDIQSILTELADGSLVLVSTLDPDDPDKVLNEIYMVDKNTGELCEEPLNIPDNIVQCILTVVN